MWSTQRERNRKREWWESSFNASLCFGVFIPFISSPPVLHHPGPSGSHSVLPFLSSTLPPFHFGSLASCLYDSPLDILSINPPLTFLPKLLTAPLRSVCHSSSAVGWFAASFSPQCVIPSINSGQKSLLRNSKISNTCLSPFLLSLSSKLPNLKTAFMCDNMTTLNVYRLLYSKVSVFLLSKIQFLGVEKIPS